MFFGPQSFDLRRALASLKTDTLYNASVVLYGSALLKDKSRYLEALSSMESKFKETPNNSFKAWMLGRVALAATHMGDHETAAKTIPTLKDLLEQKEVAEDESRAWALGYLASVNPAEYKTHRESMLRAANKVTKKADELWAHVMNLQAAARAQDENTFNDILEQMKTTTGKNTVVEALAEIPENDWRAWAMGITAEMAAKMGKRDLLQELERPLTSAIINADKANSTGNAMLAQISATAAAAVAAVDLQQEIPRRSMCVLL